VIALLLAALTIARVLAGEVGVLGPDAALLVATTMQARVQDGRFGATLTEVLADGYYADAPATAESQAIAWALVTGHLPAGPWLYAYSDADVRRMGWEAGDIVLRRGELALHLAREAP
jgi:hypothetical protein